MAEPKIKAGSELPGERWTVGEIFAEGRRFRVFAGADAHLDGKRVAIKVPRQDAWTSADEARAAMRLEGEFLTSPSALIPEPLDFAEIDGWPVLVMEFISGETLAARLSAGREIGVVRAMAIVRELAYFADDLRARGFLFRGFAPEHILVGLDDVVHVVGTGNAVRTSADNAHADSASLGALIAKLVPNAPPALRTIVSRGTAERYGTPLDFARELASLRIEVEPIPPPSPRESPRPTTRATPAPREEKRKDAGAAAKPDGRRAARRRVWPWVIAAIVGVAGAAAAVYFLALHGR